MSNYTSDGAAPVEDGAVAELPTVDEVLDEQRRLYPEQFLTNLHGPHPRRPEQDVQRDR